MILLKKRILNMTTKKSRKATKKSRKKSPINTRLIKLTAMGGYQLNPLDGTPLGDKLQDLLFYVFAPGKGGKYNVEAVRGVVVMDTGRSVMTYRFYPLDKNSSEGNSYDFDSLKEAKKAALKHFKVIVKGL